VRGGRLHLLRASGRQLGLALAGAHPAREALPDGGGVLRGLLSALAGRASRVYARRPPRAAYPPRPS
jgi:hypothetical protein